MGSDSGLRETVAAHVGMPAVQWIGERLAERWGWSRMVRFLWDTHRVRVHEQTLRRWWADSSGALRD